MNIWPAGAPGSKGVGESASLIPYHAKQTASAGAPAIIICPGGAYKFKSMNNEGYKVAGWLNTLGVHAFILDYRLPNDNMMTNKTIGPLMDAQQVEFVICTLHTLHILIHYIHSYRQFVTCVATLATSKLTPKK